MKKTKVLAVAAAGVLALGSTIGFAGCNKDGKHPTGELGRETTLYVSLINSSDRVSNAYTKLADTYNDTVGKTDDVEVVVNKNTGTPDYKTVLNPKTKNNYDVMTIDNMTFKQVLVSNFDGANAIVPLDDYLKDAANAELLGLSDIPETSIDMWRMTQASGEDGMFRAGAASGAQQLALPFVNNPQVLFYNTEHFSQMGINMISVPEGDLAAYNAAHGTNLKPHGYAEYTPDAVGGDLKEKTSENLQGKQVVKVFNNCIPMNWEELRTVAQLFQKMKGSGSYGYMSEWWFNYGWSVGGDCIGWNGDEYEFTIGDKEKGLLVIDETLTVNGTVYYQGDVIDYEDRDTISAAKRTEMIEAGNVAELPSMYDAFLEFNRLGVPSDKDATDSGVKGYGIAPTTVDDRGGLFSDGKSPMLCEYYSEQNAYKAKLGGKFDLAPLAQYREYEGDPYDDGKLNVIGENGYTGDLATATNSKGEEVAIVGEAVSAVEPTSSGMFLPANADESRRAAALKFLLWACGPEGQEILAESCASIPSQMSFAEDEDFLRAEGKIVKNMYGALLINRNTYVGDWSYDSSDTWVQTWSGRLNTTVRRGEETLDKFLSDIERIANNSIKNIGVYTKRT